MRIGYVLGISLQMELLLLSFCGIMITIFDASLLEFNSNLRKIWDIRLNPVTFSEPAEMYVKYVLSAVLLVRTFTIHIYLGTYIILLYPLIFEDRPGLIIPWMVINAFKCLLTGFASVMTGFYICAMYKFTKPTCWEFLLSDVLEYAPSIYMFCLVRNFHRELNKLIRISKYIDPDELKARRRRTRLITDSNNTLKRKSCDGLTTMRKDIMEAVGPTMHNLVSISPFDVHEINLGAGSTWQDTDVTLFSMRDAVVSGRSFKVSGTMLEILAESKSSQQDNATETSSIQGYEQVQRVSNLDPEEATYQAPGPSHIDAESVSPNPSTIDVALQEKAATTNVGGNAASDKLLHDPNIAIVLDLIAGKDDPFRTDLSILDNYEISLEEEDPKWAVDDALPEKGELLKNSADEQPEATPSPAERSLKSEKRDATNQVCSPKFEQVMSCLARVSTNMMNSVRKISQEHFNAVSAEPARVHLYVENESKRPRSHSPDVNQIYKNQAAHPRTFKNDGYTQAYEEKMLKLREAQIQQQFQK